jgi:hypothetical protein
MAFGVTWIQRMAALVALVGLVATLSVASQPAESAANGPADDLMSLSMVELLGDESASVPVSLSALGADVLSSSQISNGGDGTGIDIALIDSGVAPVDGLDGPNVVYGPDLSGEGAFGEVAKDAPVVLIGDYNLVGSRKPLDIINAAGLCDVICTAGDGTAHTWRGLKADESFWPGRLDLVSTTGFQSVDGRVFDAGRLTEAELAQLSVEKAACMVADHFILVFVDCRSR